MACLEPWEGEATPPQFLSDCATGEDREQERHDDRGNRGDHDRGGAAEQGAHPDGA